MDHQFEVTTRVKSATETEPAYIIAKTNGMEFRVQKLSAPEGEEGHRLVAVAMVRAWLTVRGDVSALDKVKARHVEPFRDGYRMVVTYG